MASIKKYANIDYDIHQILRYAHSSHDDHQTISLINDCISEIGNRLSLKVCYDEYTISFKDDKVDLGFCITESVDLCKHIKECKSIILFGATIGFQLDRLIEKYTNVLPSRAYILDAIGNERIEALCDAFEKDMARNHKIATRFSPGYGDLSLGLQKDIFGTLDLERTLGINLNSSLLMTPTKSVCAIIGLIGENNESTSILKE